MARVHVRNLDDDVLATLRRKADLHGRSLEQELRTILTAAAQLTGMTAWRLFGAFGRRPPWGCRKPTVAT